MSPLVVALMVLAVTMHTYQALSWSYSGVNGKASWGRVAMLCETGRSQSPIDLEFSRTQHDGSMGALGIRQVHDTPANDYFDDANQSRLKYKQSLASSPMKLFNNGHSVQVNIAEEVYLEGAGLQDKFKVAQLHFHWGQESDRGSEHKRMGKHFAMEMHIVSYDSSKYASLGEAVGKEDSLAVVGVFFRVGKFDNHALDNIVGNLQNVHRADATYKVTIPRFQVSSLLPVNVDNYYRYHGSLTTPGCQESVVWTVMDMPNYVSEHQLKHFRSVLQHSGDYLADNYRDVQGQHHRHVIRSFPREIDYIVVERLGSKDSATESPRTAGASSAQAMAPVVVALMSALVYTLSN